LSRHEEAVDIMIRTNKEINIVLAWQNDETINDDCVVLIVTICMD